MKRPGLIARFWNALLRPRQLMMVDGRSGRPARNMMVRPMTIFAVPAVLLAASFVAGVLYSPPGTNSSLIPQNLQLQREYDASLEKIAENEAMNELKSAQINSLQSTIDQQQARIENLKVRINMFESILEARKTAGVQLLKANVRRVGDNQLEYNLVLVKGGNYPRRVTGHIQLLAIDAKQTETPLLIENGLTNLPYRMETHTFLHGTASWKPETTPEKFIAVLYDRRGRELSRTQCETHGGSK